MRRSRRKGGKGLQAEMNIVPYVDVMFVLLTIFMVTATTIPIGVEINAPEMESDSSYEEVIDEYVMVSVDKEGRYFLSESDDPTQALTEAELASSVQKLIMRNGNVQVFVQADAAAPYGSLVNIMGRLGKITGRKVQLTTPQGE